ncbi:MAG: tRNA 2-thiouridine(34) synthase MnmA [Candidatus Muproteobacteria bacterium RIFCSPHIGHO2_12_FULL_60_33]|uniref:tRNA-specific 2-thiouridylase MnmA n=1 Tax=Candidatus Muproteobacteria bacterium RIFCSPLOWO2_01_FULL_60_18 TaxID=1817768 RepID=A0A1F6U212_9PROT|nr:MAG: tRNA 2-thiouridine(34) synthase MnmA [Candidatus Muproteobacteria bacterium RIFCSPHIGHO2_01_60_12]OGI51359.1 MAG: tRNA 2-thiouridine(34) synthase MnmA [Candidatus Muproteobacteria bacterium RIFCSPLOWO2_01_FULL_60_18]OGI55575.1 MAG: tRNA 2-thiouridine(34) synthase MnmA [Candidatus Muproteobacteria bacterium RIFCSPHIGHO2_12_FULL_60_33]
MKIIVGISGGVDSAVAALLLKRRGHEVTGLFMKNWEEDDSAGRCGAAEDLKIARAVCDHLGIPLKTVNFSTEYWDRVFSYFLAEYRAGRTPNPDVLCNKEIKFKAFLDHALALGAEYIATGHYARVDNHAGRFRLLKARDINKDQSYFLYLLGQESLAHTLFPIGELAKPEVRRLAQEAGLPNYDRQDSTGICFIGERDFKSFLARYLPAQAGEMRTLAGLLKGKHDGVMYYTIGQRHGLGIGGEGEAWYVVGKDVANNILYVEQGEQHPALFSEALIAGQLHWIGAEPLPWPRKLRAKTRYRQPDQDCTVAPHDKGLRVMFDNPQRAVTPGQSVVFYDSGECLGGGIIEEAIPATRAVAARSALH